MQITFATYQHTKPGFPKVVLKWHEQDGKALEPYVTIKGVVSGWGWEMGFTPTCSQDYQKEMDRFDKWVAGRFSNDISVQG